MLSGVLVGLPCFAVLIFLIMEFMSLFIADAPDYPFGFLVEKLGLFKWKVNRRIQKRLKQKPICLDCSRIHSADEKFCLKCGKDLQVAPMPVAPKCPGCQMELDDNPYKYIVIYSLLQNVSPYFCTNCGKNLKEYLLDPKTQKLFSYNELFYKNYKRSW
jgi:hypothetical protein